MDAYYFKAFMLDYMVYGIYRCTFDSVTKFVMKLSIGYTNDH